MKYSSRQPTRIGYACTNLLEWQGKYCISGTELGTNSGLSLIRTLAEMIYVFFSGNRTK